MAISYKKLWKLLIDKDMRNEDVRLKPESLPTLWLNSVKMKMSIPKC